MTEEVIKKLPIESVPLLSKERYEGKFDIGYYDLKIFTTVEGLIGQCEDGYKVRTSQAEIEKLCENDLLEFVLDKKDEKKMFPLFMADRVRFINDVQSKFNYSVPKLQQIIAYENGLLPYGSKACDFYYADRKDIYGWSIKRIKFKLDVMRELLKCLKILENKYRGNIKKKKFEEFFVGGIASTKEAIEDIKDSLIELSKCKWEDLSRHQKDEVKEIVFKQQLEDELERISRIRRYYNKILHGYSPQVEFKESELHKKDLDFDGIDWDKTFCCVEEYVKFILILLHTGFLSF